MSNVDNLGARVDPVVVGAHLLGGTALTIEVARQGRGHGRRARARGRAPRAARGSAFPAGLRPRPDRRLQHQHGGRRPERSSTAPTTSAGCTWRSRSTVAPRCSWSACTTSCRGSSRHGFSRCRAAVRAAASSPIKTPDDLARAQDDLREMLAAPLALGTIVRVDAVLQCEGDTDPARSRDCSVRTFESWRRGGCCCRRGAPSAGWSGRRSVSAVSARWCVSPHRGASAAERRAPGRCGAVPSARDGVSPSPPLARQSPTTRAGAASYAPGRREAGETSQRLRRGC